MIDDPTARARQTVDSLYRTESRCVLATLIRLLGDFDLAEEALQDAFAVALQQWPADGTPVNPRGWLISTGRFRAIDRIRRRATCDRLAAAHACRLSSGGPADDDHFEDDRLRLIFTCCHPALSRDAQIALTLRTVCGLTTEEIAHAFLTPLSTLAQRIIRAKGKIRDARIPYEVPDSAELAERLRAVLDVVYLVFNEGSVASSGPSDTRPHLSDEALRLGRLVMALLPEPEAAGLVALMLLHESRRAARTSPCGEIVLLDEQNRALWDRAMIAEGVTMVDRLLGSRRLGPYSLQAAIAAVHAIAPSAAVTDWHRVVGLYDLLLRADPSPVVELNRAAAVAMRDGPEAGLALIDAILARGEPTEYQVAHSARADLCRRLGRRSDAIASYRTALNLTRQEPQRRFIERWLRELDPWNTLSSNVG